MTKPKPKCLKWERHFAWNRIFHKENRIAANFNKPHPNYPLHDHEFMEVVVIVGGTCFHRSAIGETQGVAGDVFLFRPGAWHEYKDVKNLSLYNCCFDPALLGSELGWAVNNPLLGRLLWAVPLSPAQHGTVALHLSKVPLARVKKILDELCGLSKHQLHADFVDQLSLILQLLNVLSHHLPPDSPASQHTPPHPAITTAIKMLDENFAELWTLPLLAEKVQLHADYFCHLFSKVVGLSPMNYLARRRLEMATSLLRRTSLPVAEVGAAVGWLDASYFTRRFHSKFGLSPSNYRARFVRVQQRPREQSAESAFET